MSFNKNNASSNRGFKKTEGTASESRQGSENRFSRPKSNENKSGSKARDIRDGKEPSTGRFTSNSPRPNTARKSEAENPNHHSRSNTNNERYSPKSRDVSEYNDASLGSESVEKKHYRPSSRPSSATDSTTRSRYTSRSERGPEERAKPRVEARETTDGYATELKPPRTSSKQVSTKEGGISDDSMRLNRFISNAGICSRREADILIQKGLITVNGVITMEMGTIVKKTDKVIYNGLELNSEKKIYILLNKPKDVVTTREDEHAKLTVLDLVRNACTERIYPVGRLDKNTTGVLLLTNDGELTKKLTHPKYERKKIYHVHLDKPVTKAHMDEIISGVKLEDGKIVPDSLEYVDNDKSQVGIEIHSGKNRIVRRIFEHFGYRIVKLDRVYFAGLTKKGLQRSHWRHLTEQEVKLLKAGLLT